jgi:hypothetical protein
LFFFIDARANCSKVMGAATGALDMAVSVAANKEPMNGKKELLM